MEGCNKEVVFVYKVKCGLSDDHLTGILTVNRLSF